MSEDNLGSGPSLDEDLDFEIDETGDIRSSSGMEELQKDLSFQMMIALSQFIGENPTPELNVEVRRKVYRVAVSDERISSVDRKKINVEWYNHSQELTVSVPVTTTENATYEMVFGV